MICFVFRPSRRIDGKKIVQRLYSARIKLPGDPTARTIPLGVSDVRVARQKLNDLVKERELLSHGLAVPATQTDAASTPLTAHLSHFLADLVARGRTVSTSKRYRNLLSKLFRDAGWTYLRDISVSSFSIWRSRRKQKPHYSNDALGAALTLLNWLEKQGSIPSNPLRHAEKVTDTNAGTYRRALSKQEVDRLLANTPPSRSWVYLTILYTGLRRHELNLLKGAHFNLVSKSVELPAAITKNRKDSRLPLRAEVVDILRSRIENNPDTFFFKGKVPSPRALRIDLAKAGIPYCDTRGRVVDLHALRTTFGTLLSSSGVAPRVAMELMRHSDLKLTMKIYTDVAQLPLAQDVDRLPAFSACAQIHSSKVDAGSRNVSQPVETSSCNPPTVAPQAVAETEERRSLTQAVAG